MTTKFNRRYDRDFKLAAVGRMEAGENVAALSRELGVVRKLLYDWRRAFRLGGASALREQGRPGKDERVIAARDREPSAIQTPPSGYAVRSKEADELAAARHRIAALERRVGQQTLELDFSDQPCHSWRPFAGRPERLAGVRLRSHPRTGAAARRRRASERGADVCALGAEPCGLLSAMAGQGTQTGRGRLTGYDTAPGLGQSALRLSPDRCPVAT